MRRTWGQPSRVIVHGVPNITVSDVLQALLVQALCFMPAIEFKFILGAADLICILIRSGILQWGIRDLQALLLYRPILKILDRYD